MTQSNSATMIRSSALFLIACLMFAEFGCRVSQPQGTPIQPAPLGSVVDQINQQQEDNAEPAKFIVYVHEFELNKPLELPEEYAMLDEYEGVEQYIIRGFRLNQKGQDHVRRIARELSRGATHHVTIERSATSRQWLSRYRYPVHWNSELDQHRRQVVINSLVELGIENASELVFVAPAYPEGLHSEEAAQAYDSMRSSNNQGGGSGAGNSGGGFGGF